MTTKKSVTRRGKKSMTLATKKNEQKSYDSDFYKWTKNQASFLKKGELSKLDIDHLIEEIESLGRSEKRAFESYLANLLLHLLKIEHQPKKHSKSWDLSIKNSRRKIKTLLEENPSLKRYIPKMLNEAYFTARLSAIAETGLQDEKFSEECPWDFHKIMKE